MTPHQLPKDILADIGAVTVEAESLEWLVAAFIKQVLEIDNFSWNLLAGERPLTARLKLLEQIVPAQISTKKDKDDFVGCLKRIRTAIGRRNIVIHGEWNIDEYFENSLLLETGKPGRVKAQATSKKGVVRHDELESVRKDLEHSRSLLLKTFEVVFKPENGKFVRRNNAAEPTR